MDKEPPMREFNKAKDKTTCEDKKIEFSAPEDISAKTEACENFFYNESRHDSCEGCGYFFICLKSPYFDLRSSSPESMPFNPVMEYIKISREMSRVYRAKNEDYGDSFAKSIQKHGLIAAVVRIEDKISRIKNLTKRNADLKVKSESIDDTLLDLANYSIMTMLEITPSDTNKYNRHENLTNEMSKRYGERPCKSKVIDVSIQDLSIVFEEVVNRCGEINKDAPSEIVKFKLYLALLDIADIAIEIIIELRREKFDAESNNS